MTKTVKKRERAKISSKNYAYLDKNIRSGEGTFEHMKKQREELKKNMMSNEKMSLEEQSKLNLSRENFLRMLFLNLQKGLNTAKVANSYLFEATKKKLEGKLKGEIYKIQVIKKDEKGIRCLIKGENGYTNEIGITNKEILESRLPTDTLDTVQIGEKRKNIPELSWEANEHFKRKQPKPLKITQEDFLDEIQRRDSVIIKSENGKITKLQPEEIINEIGKYLKHNGEKKKSAEKIHTALNFLNEANEELATEYIKEVMRFFKSKEKKRKLKGSEYENRKNFGEVLKRFINTKNIYVHKENDIDKSASEFLLKRLGIIDKNKEFQGIDHHEVDNIDEGIFIDIGGTATGIKTIQKKEKTIEQGKKKTITKTKIIGSEHSDKSIEAMFKTRPTSATQIIFKIFKELGQIKKSEIQQIQRFVNFVNTIDSMEYQASSLDYPNNYQTVFGLYRLIPIHKIFDHFANPEHTGFEELPGNFLQYIKIKKKRNGKIEETTLKEESREHKKNIENDIKNFNELKKQGNRVLVYRGTKFIVDIENKIKNGPQTAGYHGYGFFKIYPQRGNIYIYSPKKLPEKIEGYSTDGHFLIINTPTTKDIETLFEKFSTDAIQKTSLKKDMITYLKEVQKNKTIIPISNEILEKMITTYLPSLQEKDIQVNKTYKGIINNVQKNMIFISLNKEKTLRARYEIPNKEEAKKFKKGDMVEVNISSIQENIEKKKKEISIGAIKKITIKLY